MRDPVNWSSQAGQDEWVYSLIGDGGFFVDVGAHDGIVHSNTYALEALHGWSGICIEPDPEAYVQLSQNRDGVKIDVAASREVSVISIWPSGVERPAWPLTRILQSVRAPHVIDYLSIDVEGHELDVLTGMDFEQWYVKLITIEHNLYLRGPDHKEQIREMLALRGFRIERENVVAEGYGPYEDWYANVRERQSVTE